jgi:hypothetical protein
LPLLVKSVNCAKIQIKYRCYTVFLSHLTFWMFNLKLLFYDDESMTSIYLKKNAVDILQSERRIKKTYKYDLGGSQMKIVNQFCITIVLIHI